MHDLIKQMCEGIVLDENRWDPRKRSRLWRYEHIVQVLNKSKGAERVEALSLDMSGDGRIIQLSPKVFEGMDNLRLLSFFLRDGYWYKNSTSKLHLPQQGLEYLPNTLRLLHWDLYPSPSLPSNFRPESIVYLKMHESSLTQLWEGDNVVLNFMWLKFLLIWRYFRLWSLICGIEAPENMPKCINNCYNLEGFWKNWHASYNKWLVRYMYIPLGGSRRKLLNVWVIFTFVAIWHDLEWKLLSWAWLTCLFFIPEMVAKSAANAFQVQSSFGEFLFRELSAVAGAITITCLMVANLVGYVIGPSGINWLISQFLTIEGLPVLGGLFVTFYIGTKGAERVEALSLDMSGDGRTIQLSPKVFEGMDNLRLLSFFLRDGYWYKNPTSKLHLPQQGLEYLPNTLRLLHWDLYPSPSLPSNFRPESIVYLKMHESSLTQLWEGDNVHLVSLKVCDLSESKELIKIMDLSGVPNLEELNVGGCDLRLTSLEEVDLYNCPRITQLPELPSTVKSLYLGRIGIKQARFLKPNFMSDVRFQVQSSFGEFLFRELSAVPEMPASAWSLSVFAFWYNLSMYRVGNLVGYVIGPSGINWLISQFLTIEGLPVLGGLFVTFYIGTDEGKMLQTALLPWTMRCAAV
ncbi:hypothetical protein Tsubulata_050280 [Turnera subulata]|uniref:Uncharacterized protein n=1 Tax=Turnera subulata TaxID=218843 RepID=A0A9Q0G8Z1_9ROSI|nr:hypothetical protein Tsubulata_050280 [Turnera subulata]